MYGAPSGIVPRFDFLPADLASTTIQVRGPKATPEPAAADPFEDQVADA